MENKLFSTEWKMGQDGNQKHKDFLELSENEYTACQTYEIQWEWS